MKVFQVHGREFLLLENEEEGKAAEDVARQTPGMRPQLPVPKIIKKIKERMAKNRLN